VRVVVRAEAVLTAGVVMMMPVVVVVMIVVVMIVVVMIVVVMMMVVIVMMVVVIVMMMVMLVLVCVLVHFRVRGFDVDMSFGADERAALHALVPEAVTGERELAQLAGDGVERHAGVEQRAQRHVAGDAREAVEVQRASTQRAHASLLRFMSAAA
jgi:hypothetical protein